MKSKMNSHDHIGLKFHFLRSPTLPSGHFRRLFDVENINIVDTSIEHLISSQSTTVVKCCTYIIMVDVVDLQYCL